MLDLRKRASNSEFLLGQITLHERIEMDKLKCWDQKTDAKFWIYERLSSNFRGLSVNSGEFV